MASAFEKWAEKNGMDVRKSKLSTGDYALVSSWTINAKYAWDAALEEAAKEIKQRFVERNQFGEMVYCADLEQVVRELKEQK